MMKSAQTLATLLRPGRFQLRPARRTLSAVVVFFAAAAVGQMEVQRLRQQRSGLADEIRLLERQLPARFAFQPASARANLPPAEDVGQVAADLHALAAERRLTVTEVSFSSSAVAGSANARQISITVHMKGTYPALKTVLATLLWSHETLALDRLWLRRGDSVSGQDIIVSLSFFCSSK